MHQGKFQSQVEKECCKYKEKDLAQNPGGPPVCRESFNNKIDPDMLVISCGGGYADSAEPDKKIFSKFIGKYNFETNIPRQDAQEDISDEQYA